MGPGPSRNPTGKPLTEPVGSEGDRSAAAGTKRVFLTFDDGPCDPFTARILDVLGAAGAKATFFACGRNVERHPGLARRIVEEGHSIGNHTYSHSKARALLGAWGNEIERAEAVIAAVTGARARCFRPPWGMMRPWLARRLEAAGYRWYLWDIWARDWENPGEHVITRRVVDGIHPGSIVLLHDGEKSLASTDRRQTAAALRGIIAELGERGYEFDAL